MRDLLDEKLPGSQNPSLAKLNSIQEQLDELRDRLIGHQSDDSTDMLTLGRLAQEILRSRRRRFAVFQGSGLFGEPAWDILLWLYVADDAQQKLSITELCDVAGLPLSTGLRWIERLESETWVSRAQDPVDRRRFWVHLSERASNLMREYLDGIRLRPSQK
jgi:DNA-binding MarR family transcriptional regulator